jgi:hypothetical protein
MARRPHQDDDLPALSDSDANDLIYSVLYRGDDLSEKEQRALCRWAEDMEVRLDEAETKLARLQGRAA